MKTCSKCKTEKPKADFYRCTAKKDGLHVPNNLQVIPATENLAKSNKHKG